MHLLSLRTICAPFLAVYAATAAFAPPALAQDSAIDTDDVMNLDVIIVTGAPVAQDVFHTPADVDVIAGKVLEEQRTAGLGQTLDVLPGLNVVATGGQVGNPVIRGLSGTRIRVLSDGIGLNFQQYGMRHPANLDPYLADRIEIVRGPASLQYGSDAIGGAINVIPQKPPVSTAGEVLFGGELGAGFSTGYEAGEGALTLRGAIGAFGAEGTFVVRQSQGVRTPDEATVFESGDNSDPLVSGNLPFTDYDQMNGDLSFGYQGDRLDAIFRWESFDSDQNYLVPDPGRPVAPGGLGQALENDLYSISVSYDINGLLTVKPHLARVKNVRRANAGGADPVALPVPDGVANTDITRDSYTSRLVLEHGDIGGFEGQVGVEFVHEEQESIGPNRLTPGGLIQNNAVFIFEKYEIGSFLINAGLRYDERMQKASTSRTSNLVGLPSAEALAKRDYSAFTGGLGVSYQFNDNLVAAGNVRTAFRAPELFELYANGQHNGVAAVQIGDQNLSEENAVTIDGSLRWRSDQFDAVATIYKTDFDDYITLIGTGGIHPSGLPVFEYFQDDAGLWGGDVDLLWRPGVNWELGLVYEMVRGEFDASGASLPLLPADTVQARVRRDFAPFGVFKSAYVEATSKYAAEKDAEGRIEPFYTFDLPGSPFGAASTDDYVLYGLSAGAELGDLSVRLEANNLFDEAYREFLDTYKSIALSPGRDVRITATYSF